MDTNNDVAQRDTNQTISPEPIVHQNAQAKYGPRNNARRAARNKTHSFGALRSRSCAHVNHKYDHLQTTGGRVREKSGFRQYTMSSYYECTTV